MAVLGYISKLIQGLGLAFGTHFKHDFSLKVVCATFLLVCFVSVTESTCETRKKKFSFHFKSSFRSQENQILEF